MILKHDKIIIYKEKIFPPLKFFLGWNYVITSKKIQEELDTKKIICKNLNDVAEQISQRYQKEDITLYSSPRYKAKFWDGGPSGSI